MRRFSVLVKGGVVRAAPPVSQPAKVGCGAAAVIASRLVSRPFFGDVVGSLLRVVCGRETASLPINAEGALMVVVGPDDTA